MKYLLLLILFVFNLLFAQKNMLTDEFINSTPSQIYNHSNIQDNKKKEIYIDTFSIKTIEQNYNNNNQITIGKNVNLLTPKNKNNTIVTQYNKSLNTTINQTNNQVANNFYLNGYCVVPNKVTVDRLSATVVLNCNFSNNLNGKLTALFVPDLYSKALIAKPLYLTFNNNPQKRYFVIGGVLMNATQTNLNIASIVNDRKIAQFLAKSGIDSANIVTQNAMKYLQERIKARQQTSVTYMKDENGNIVPIQQQQNQPPKISDYIAVTSLQLLSNIVNNVSNMFYENLPYLFLVKQNTLLYADLFVTNKVQGLPSFNIPTNNIIVKNPPYSKEQPSQIILQPINKIQTQGGK